MAVLSDLKIAILVGNGINQDEVAIPREAFEKASIQVETISKSFPEVKAQVREDWQIPIKVNKKIKECKVDEYNAILLPGGKSHTEAIRKDKEIMDLIKQFFAAGKIIGVMSEGILLLIDAEIIADKVFTSLPALRHEVERAGGLWQDQDVVIDNGIVSCRCEKNLDDFTKSFLDELREGVHQRTETII